VSGDLSTHTDPRLATLQRLLSRLVAGDFRARADALGDDPTDAHDPLSQMLHDTNQLAETISQQHAVIEDAEHRSAELLDAMMRMAARDYTTRVSVGDGDTLFDALAAGLNMLADEFFAAQEERERLQEEIIQTQAAVIQELSTPLIPINGDILVMPLIGNVDSARAKHVLERLLEGVATNHTQTVILDITGVTLVDAHVANTLVRAAQAVQLLGTQMILTGIRPEVAQTLVNLGIELRGLMTWSTLQMGITYAMRHTSQNLALQSR
jgi:anti-anti-sigma factor